MNRALRLTRVWVQAEVYEKDLGRVRVGQTAYVSVDTYPGEPFAGRVTYVSDVLDPKTRTAKVRCEVPNRDVRLKLDMFATVALPTTFHEHALAVPVGAIQQIEGRGSGECKGTPTHADIRGLSAYVSVLPRLTSSANGSYS